MTSRQAKVAELDINGFGAVLVVGRSVNEEILRLDIAMADAMSVAPLYCLAHLGEHVGNEGEALRRRVIMNDRVIDRGHAIGVRRVLFREGIVIWRIPERLDQSH